MIKNILLAFIPVFFAVDAIGTLPVFISLMEGTAKREQRKIILQSMTTALCLAVGFIFLGKVIFKLLGISVGDFMIAGGTLLFIIALNVLLKPGKEPHVSLEEVGAVPLGTPLIVGPAVLTTSLIIIEQYGLAATLVSVFINILLAGLIFSGSDVLIKVLGYRGSRALSKITALFLSSIAVMMIRKGIIGLFYNQ